MTVSLSQRAIFSPRIDLLATSGVSLVLVFLIVGLSLITQPTTADQDYARLIYNLLILQIFLNWPHFLFSYRILYGSSKNFREAPGATIIVPTLLVLFCFAATLPVFGGNGLLEANVSLSTALWIVGALYLAWHYTGQAWGTMMVFAHLTNFKTTGQERFILKLGFKAIIVWHVVWGLQTLNPLPYLGWLQSELANDVSNVLAVLAFITGAAVFARKLLKGETVDIRILGAWLALYAWYLLLWINPKAFLIVQVSHAVQYMFFTTRVELNRNPFTNAKKRAALVYALSVVGGLVIFYFPEVIFSGATELPTFFFLIGIAVNIHHYYTDSAIWKMRKEGVRNSLFSHLKT